LNLPRAVKGCHRHAGLDLAVRLGLHDQFYVRLYQD
jgi:hypothetical protein